MKIAHSNKVLYLPSTPLNTLVSVAHAVSQTSKQTSKLLLIDQSSDHNNVYFKALKNWKTSPFIAVEVMLGDSKGKQKLIQRNANFKRLAEFVKKFSADAIAVGSDRRIEFQYLMHLRREGVSAVEGWYLDDGLYSYAGRPYHWLKDSINSILKKLTYGFWWEEPKTVGASSLIQQAWLFRPNIAIPELQVKALHAMPNEWFTHPAVLDFSHEVLECFGYDDNFTLLLKKIDVLILTPHPNNIMKMPGFKKRLEYLLVKLHKLNLNVAIKPHPKSMEEDFLSWQNEYQVSIIPSLLAFEFVLPMLKPSMKVVGDVGTSVLTAKWLRSDLEVGAVLNSESKFESRFEPILNKLEIPVHKDYEWVLEKTGG